MQNLLKELVWRGRVLSGVDDPEHVPVTEVEFCLGQTKEQLNEIFETCTDDTIVFLIRLDTGNEDSDVGEFLQTVNGFVQQQLRRQEALRFELLQCKVDNIEALQKAAAQNRIGLITDRAIPM